MSKIRTAINKTDQENSNTATPMNYQWHFNRPHHHFFILERFDIFRSVEFISRFIRLYIPNNSSDTGTGANLSFHHSTTMLIASYLHGFITVAAIMAILQISFRVIISASIFIIAYSLYFSNVITISIPFIYYFYLIHYHYYQQHNGLSSTIAEALPVVDKHIDKILNASEGEIEIYFKIMEADQIGKKIIMHRQYNVSR